MQNVLLVEDDARSLVNMEAAAKDARGGERRILTATNRESAIRVINEEDVDVVVTDLALHSRSDTDGFDVLRTAKEKTGAYFTARKTEAALDLDAFDVIDRAASSSDPQVLLRLEIGKALRLREALRT
jgi:CheY-like chemotaxis protein